MPERLAHPIGRRALGLLALEGAGAAALCLLGAPACRRPPSEPLVKPFMYRDTPQELHRLWSDILAACRADDRNRVHDLMVSLIMTQPELASLLGPQKAAELWPRYQAMMSTMCNTGAVELVAHVYEKKYDDVAVTRAHSTAGSAEVPAPTPQAEPSLSTNTDVAVANALVAPTPFYTVRVKKKSEATGLRYDFFVYRNGFWRSGNQLGKFLLPPPPLPSG
jgi:hypothetical protein